MERSLKLIFYFFIKKVLQLINRPANETPNNDTPKTNGETPKPNGVTKATKPKGKRSLIFINIPII